MYSVTSILPYVLQTSFNPILRKIAYDFECVFWLVLGVSTG
ncbi:hypothetical protein SAMN05216597_3725 [Pseudomonas cannabina]|nr:hypothetical protein SAMN05216597_3725 [Pseudomonas cannabina]